MKVVRKKYCGVTFNTYLYAAAKLVSCKYLLCAQFVRKKYGGAAYKTKLLVLTKAVFSLPVSL